MNLNTVLIGIQNAIKFAREPRHAATVILTGLAFLVWPFLIASVMRGHLPAEILMVAGGGGLSVIAAIFWAAKTTEEPTVPYWFLTTLVVAGSLLLASMLCDVLKVHGYETLAASALLVVFGWIHSKF